ncbi:hypothetical protein ACF1DY_25925 [Streptomyces albus]
MTSQLELFSDEDVQTDGDARPWRLKWNLADGAHNSDGDTENWQEEAA